MRICLAVHTSAHIHIYVRIRTREGIFRTVNLLYNITRPSFIISPTPFTPIIQSLYHPYPYWHHIGCAICTNCRHLLSSVTHLHPFIIYPPTIQSSLAHLPNYFPSPYNSQSSRTHYIPSLSDFHSNQLTILSICQYVIKHY